MKNRETLLTIVEDRLRHDGFDGLFNTDAECACIVGDLFPCDSPQADCRPGVKVPGCTPDCREGCDFHVMSKDAARDVLAERGE